MITTAYKPASKSAHVKQATTVTLASFTLVLAGFCASLQAAGLTPSGAEQAGTASGIPEWKAPQPALPGWSYGQSRKDYFIYKADAPLFSIDSSNVDKYGAQLNPGQVELIKDIKGYSMPVYPSRRTCGMPDFVAKNTQKNVGFSKINNQDNSLVDAHLPGFPFPEPETGAEAMWNSKLRYRGAGLEQYGLIVSVSPRKGSSDWIKVTADQYNYYPWGNREGTTFADVKRVEAMVYFSFLQPAAMAGQAATFTGAADKPAEAYYYFPGQRRTRRMPSYSYDAPQLGYENQYNIDESYVFAGLMDRFDWKLVGKQELIVPYNALGMYDFKAKYEDVMQPNFVSAAQRRYELHRVWVVEATVKAGMRHSAPKRLFYIDEDSWALVGAVDYDAQGNITKVREGHVIPVYETGSCDSYAFVQYNLSSGRYVMDGSPLASGKDLKWIVDAVGNPHMKMSFYNPENLRAMSER